MKVSTFRADTHSINKKTGEYSDPMMKWPLRGAAFTNEIGEALRPLIGDFATVCWVPALMYIGADIYDKYKNDKTEYSPDSKRLLKQAMFQGLASILLPLVAVKGGQNLLSLLGRLAPEKLSINTQEQISKIAETFIANGQMRAFHNNEEECINTFLERVHNNIDFTRHKSLSKNPIKKMIVKVENIIYKLLKINNKSLDKYAIDTIKDLIEIRKNILNPVKDFKNSKIYNDFVKNLASGQTENVAIKSVLIKFQQNKMLKGKAIKTIGGFIALGALIKPIDKFVDDIVIGKVFGPSIDKYEPLKERKQRRNLQ